MANRKFKLPGVEELNKDQDKVLRLPKDGQFLIVGAPGTGKSVVALLRMLKYKDEGDYIFLVYNKVLEASTKQLVNGGLNSKTWKTWFYTIMRKAINGQVPNVSMYTPDYEKIISLLQDLEVEEMSLHIIIDEGQDMPAKFYESLTLLGLANFFVVADQNQQLTEEHSNRLEITNALALDTNDVIELKENYRNSYGVACLSQYFYTDPSSPRPNLPSPAKKSLMAPVLYEYHERTFNRKLISFILKKADRDPKWLIGIITPNNKVKDKYIQALKQVDIKLDHPKPVISTYKANENITIDFTTGGIVVLNAQSVKGLEFDIVFIADIDQFRVFNNDLDSMKKKFYVMVSRAIKQVVILKQMDINCSIESIFPDDETILKRIKESHD